MGFFKVILTPIKFIFKWLALPIFKIIRKLLWTWTLRKFFNDGLKIKFIVSIVDDFLDIIEGFLKDPASLFIFTNKSLWLIFAPWIISAVLYPIKKIAFIQKFISKTDRFNKPIERFNRPPAAAPVAPAAPAPAASAPVAPAAPAPVALAPVAPTQEGVQQQGGGIMSFFSSSSPDFTDYIGVYIFILVLYMIEKSELCGEEHKDKPDEKLLNIFQIGLVFSIFVTLFYIASYLLFPYVPIFGLFYSIMIRLPIIGTIVPGFLTYLFYNIFRNMSELLKERTKCLK